MNSEKEGFVTHHRLLRPMRLITHTVPAHLTQARPAILTGLIKIDCLPIIQLAIRPAFLVRLIPELDVRRAANCRRVHNLRVVAEHHFPAAMVVFTPAAGEFLRPVHPEDADVDLVGTQGLDLLDAAHPGVLALPVEELVFCEGAEGAVDFGADGGVAVDEDEVALFEFVALVCGGGFMWMLALGGYDLRCG
jgi:hypothetical protein